MMGEVDLDQADVSQHGQPANAERFDRSRRCLASVRFLTSVKPLEMKSTITLIFLN